MDLNIHNYFKQYKIDRNVFGKYHFIDLSILKIHTFETVGPDKKHNNEHYCLTFGGSKTISNLDRSFLIKTENIMAES